MVFKKGHIPWIKGRSHSEETKRKMRGRMFSDEHRRKISEAMKGKIFSEEHRRKISKNNARYWKGKHHSEESKRKMSKAFKGRIPWNKGLTKETDNRVKKYADSLKGHINFWNGKRHTDEAKRKISKARLKQILPTKDTSIEVALQKELDNRRIKYKTHLPIYGFQPDVIITNRKIAIFCDGDYWHSREFNNGTRWNRDRTIDKFLKKKGWKVLRFWEHEINSDVELCVNKIEDALLWQI